MTKKIKKILIFFSLLVAVFAVAHFALALDVGLDKAAGTGLSAANDPRAIAANIIRIALGFLGLIAISLIIYAGWLWMTAAGEEEKIEKAKKILISAVIGLIIILSAFAIASFILSRLLGATTGGGGDGTVCEPACGSGQYCCNSSCSNSPCGGTPPGGDSFNIRSTIPRNLDTEVIRNVVIKVFFNKTIGATVSQVILDNNFKVEKIAAIDALTKAETALDPAQIAGTIGLDPDRREINFKSSAACGNEKNTPNCLPEWSKFRVTVDSASGLISVNGQSLNCSAGSNCQFEFSTSNVIDTSGPAAGILSAQICKDDGTLASIPNANLVNGWAKDDLGVSDLRFCSEKSGGAENCLADSVKVGGLGQTYLSSSYKYDTSGYAVGDNYIFRVKANDAAGQIDKAEFSAKIRAGHCCNGVKDVNETDIDCGGQCGACDGAACANDMSAPAVCSDNLCASQVCSPKGSTADKCATAGYADGTGSCCLCQRPPVITGLSPVGGFCTDNINKACLADSDCGAGIKCDTNTANGAAGNFFTIYGRYFGPSPGKVFVSDGASGWIQAKLANDPVIGNAQCGNNAWTDGQLIAIVPANAKTGAIKVENLSGLDTTSDKTGVPDFKINTITRPGICLLNPNHGKQDEVINYNGIKLSAVNPYFGNLANKIAGLAPNFNDKDGTAKVPNLTTGRTTSFVIKGKIISNFLNFTKEAEPYKGPFISSFEPREGATGQYITINGGGFGNTRGASKIYFGAEGGVEASFDFPQICADSIWSDKQVIVKVPTGLANGNYKITMKISSWPAIDTSSIQPATDFKADSALPLKPSLCKINPIVGKVNSQISLYGEYFGPKDNNSKVRFQFNKNQTIFDYWNQDDDSKITGIKPDKIITKVPVEAVTGRVKAVKGDPELVGNGLNFTVGVCQNSAECGSGNLCCSTGTPYAGQCKVGTAEQDVCFPEIKACVYEWNFSTGGSGGGIGDPCDKNIATPQCNKDDTMCQTGLVCDPASCVCKQPCNSDTTAGTKCDVKKCGALTSTPNCNTTSCLCECTKDSDCKNYGEVCNLATGVCTPGGTTKESCAGYGNQCSDSYFCPNSPGKCSANAGGAPVDTGVKCGDAECNKLGRCKDKDGKDLCSYNSTLNKCVKIDSSCDLTKDQEVSGVVDINNNKVQLKCGSVDGKSVWYYDGQQTCVSGYSKSIDKSKCLGAACATCSAGFVCQKDGDSGICVSDINICPADSSCSGDKCVKNTPASCECCCNKTENTASGSNPGCCSSLSCGSTCGAGGDFGLCTGCTVAGDQAASNAKCNCTGTNGKFCNMAGAGGLGACLDCAALTNAAACSTEGAGSCCVDAKNKACIGSQGEAPVKSIYAGDNNNYCAYYECQTTATSAACNGPVASSTLSTYKTQADCTAKCQSPPQFGQECSTYGVANGQKTAEKICDVNQCANFSCLNDGGSGPTPPNSCGTCCCNPAPGFDNCASLNLGLKCVEGKGECSGKGRGLCCGCSQDSECGNANTGCGSSGDRCCQARPSVVEPTTPVNGATKICRNGLIKATFDQAMNINTFKTNIIVVGDYGINPCPAGTQYLTEAYKPTILARLKFWLAKIPLVNRLFATEARALTGNFCSVSGKVSGLIKTDADGKPITELEFSLQKVLEANQKYYVIIKGDSDVNDAVNNGVLSQDGIGMKAGGYNSENPVMFNGLAFANAKVWSFTTMGKNEVNEGICPLDKVIVNPSSYRFETNENDPKDDNPDDKTTFNKIADSDLVFSASAYAKNGQLLTATADYNWDWTWTPANPLVATAEKLAEPFKAIVRAQEKVADDKTEITAAANFTGTTITKQDTAMVYVILCKNIWPPPKNDGNGNLIWKPWQDSAGNCTVEVNDCKPTNFALYYCRDAGAAGTADDLPAILDQAVIRGRSENILKEFYFFREDLPKATGINLATTTNNEIKQGGKAGLVWQAVDDAQKYTVYYGTVATNLTRSITAATNGTEVEPAIISNLTNGVKYYFAVTATYSTGAESDYSNKTTAIPADVAPPATPVLSGISVVTSTASLSWEANQDDTAFYKIYYGATSGALGASASLDKNKCVNGQCELKIKNLNSGTTYYFAISALDGYNNESNKSGEISLIIK